jgi:hypothetical protein
MDSVSAHSKEKEEEEKKDEDGEHCTEHDDS